MADFDPLDFDVEKLRKRLVQRNPKPWKQPSSPLPVDRFVTELRKRTRAPKLRSPEDLSKLSELACPYAIARDGILWAATHATIRLHQNGLRPSVTAAMEQFSKDVGDGIAVIQKLYGALSTIYQAQEHAFDPAVDELSETPLRDADYLLATHSMLQRLEEPLHRLYVQRSQRVGNIWRIEFAKSLFRVWWLLTGEDPTPQGQFVEFVDDAYQSLADSLPEMSWESAINTALKHAKLEHGDDARPWMADTLNYPTQRQSSRYLFDAYADGDMDGVREKEVQQAP